MQTLTRSVAAAALGGWLTMSAAAGDPLPRSRPEAQGVSPAGLLGFIEAADREIEGMHSFMLVRHGHVVAEGWWSPYSAASRHELYSLSKSFTSTAVGLAVGEGKLKVEDRVLDFFPEDAPGDPSSELKAMRVSDLLRMSTGHQSEPPTRDSAHWAKTFLSHKVAFKPGTHFLYNTAATYMLSAIVQKATGQRVLDYLGPRLFEPLGIEGATWGESPQGVTLGGYGLSVRTEDIAKFGQLYLQKGRWGDRQIVPEAWVAAATALQTSNGSNPESDWDQGYGYQFWRCRHGAYRGDGAFGQYCIVLPEQDAVVAITSGVKDMQAVLNLIWTKLLPVFEGGVVAEDEASSEALERKLGSLMLRPAGGAKRSIAAESWVGKRYVFEPGAGPLASLTLASAGGETSVPSVRVRWGGEEQELAGEPESWRRTRLAVGGRTEQPAAVSCGWADDQTLVARVCLYETPFVITYRFRFGDGQVTVDHEANVGFGPTQGEQRVGHAE